MSLSLINHFCEYIFSTIIFKFSAETESAAFRGDPTTRSTGFGKKMGSLQDPIESFRAQSKERDANSGENIWDALGQYIARQLRNGKGVWVPKLGNFTFTGMNVDLAVSITITNFPHQLFYFYFYLGFHKSSRKRHSEPFPRLPDRQGLQRRPNPENGNLDGHDLRPPSLGRAQARHLKNQTVPNAQREWYHPEGQDQLLRGGDAHRRSRHQGLLQR